MCPSNIYYPGQSISTLVSFLTINESKVLGRDGVQVPWACPVNAAAMLLLGRYVIARIQLME